MLLYKLAYLSMLYCHTTSFCPDLELSLPVYRTLCVNYCRVFGRNLILYSIWYRCAAGNHKMQSQKWGLVWSLTKNNEKFTNKLIEIKYFKGTVRDNEKLKNYPLRPLLFFLIIKVNPASDIFLMLSACILIKAGHVCSEFLLFSPVGLTREIHQSAHPP